MKSLLVFIVFIVISLNDLPGNFPLEDVAMSILTVIAYFLVAVGTRVDVSFLWTDVAPRHDGVGVWVRQLPYKNWNIQTLLEDIFRLHISSITWRHAKARPYVHLCYSQLTCDLCMEFQELLQGVVGGEALDSIVGDAMLGPALWALYLLGQRTKEVGELLD